MRAAGLRLSSCPKTPAKKNWHSPGRFRPVTERKSCAAAGRRTRRRFAVQLCTLRAYGRFLPEATPAPVAITNYLARQLDLPFVLFGELPSRLATETEQLQRIRTYLGWRPFDERARARLTSWLNQRATDDLLPSVLVTRAEDILRAWQIVAPAPSRPLKNSWPLSRLACRTRCTRALPRA